MHTWYTQMAGIHLHRSETYKAYEAYGEWAERTQNFDDDMDSDGESEEAFRDKAQLRQHLAQEAEIERAVPTVAKPPWQVRCDHCSRVSTVTAVRQTSRCMHCGVQHGWPPRAYLRRLARELGRLSDEDVDSRREEIRVYDEYNIAYYEENLKVVTEWQRRQSREAYFEETRRLHGLGQWRGPEDNYGLSFLGLAARNSS